MILAKPLTSFCSVYISFDLPEEYWINVSDTAKDFVKTCLTIDPNSRPTADEALHHKWLADTEPHFVQDSDGNMTNLLPQIQKAFDARKTCTHSFLIDMLAAC